MSTFAVPARERVEGVAESERSAVSWSAVVSGAFVSASISLVLIALGTGLGLSEISAWSNLGAERSTLNTIAVIWLISSQVASASLGGYLAGRLRVRWSAIHKDEVYFRDTAHGLLVWAVGVVVTATALTSAAVSFTGRSIQTSGRSSDMTSYYVDTLFRSEHRVIDSAEDSEARTEAGRILSNAVTNREMSVDDQTYLAQLIVGVTGVSPNEAELRANNMKAKVRQTAEMARKQAAHSLLWVFISLLIGAFCASFAATIGGRQRDSSVGATA